MQPQDPTAEKRRDIEMSGVSCRGPFDFPELYNHTSRAHVPVGIRPAGKHMHYLVVWVQRLAESCAESTQAACGLPQASTGADVLWANLLHAVRIRSRKTGWCGLRQSDREHDAGGS